MTPLVWANVPLAMLFVLAWVGIPLWMIFKRPDSASDFSQAHAYLAAKQPQPAPHRTSLREDIAEQPELQVAG
jgi:hypothetical protein